MKQQGKMGRPKKPPEQVKTARIELRVTPAQELAWKSIGGQEWLRSVLDAWSASQKPP